MCSSTITHQIGKLFLKVVISGKYKNLNKIKNLTYLPEISQTSYFCYSPQFTMQNRGTCCLKKCFNTERSKGNFVRENLKKIASLMKMRSTLKVP